MRFSQVLSLCAFVSALAGCGGGGGGSANDSNAAASTAAAPNVMAVTVELGPSRNVNLPYAAVTICEPGSDTRCKTINHILVDTGSFGLRLFASALQDSSSSPALTLPPAPMSGGAALADCTQFADGTAIWGPVKLADVKLAGQRLDSLSVHVVGDSNFATSPSSCSDTPVTAPSDFGANGILGVGHLAQDCGQNCTVTADNRFYYACASSSCTGTTVSLDRQVTNPVALLATDNNGVILKMQPLSAASAASASGSLIFGIGTQANNALGTAQVFNLNPSSGKITTIYKGRTYANTFIDSGSNAIYFNDSELTVCSGYDHAFYCPPSTQSLTASMVGAKGNSNTVSFNVGNADQLFTANRSHAAFASLAGPWSFTTNANLPANSSTTYFDWGLPFFYGRSVYTAINGRDTPGGKGPYYAY